MVFQFAGKCFVLSVQRSLLSDSLKVRGAYGDRILNRVLNVVTLPIIVLKV